MASLEEMQSIGPTICVVQTMIQHYTTIFGGTQTP